MDDPICTVWAERPQRARTMIHAPPCPTCKRSKHHSPSCLRRTETADQLAERLGLVGPTECTHRRLVTTDCVLCGRVIGGEP